MITYLLIAAFALTLRLIYIIQLQSTVFYSYFLLDEALYNNWAHGIASGIWFKEGVFEALPLYPYILGIIYKLTGLNLFIPRFLQCLAGSFSCLLIYQITYELFKDKRAALISGLIACVYLPFIFYCGVLLPASYALFFYLVVIWLSFNTIKHQQVIYFTLLGLTTGVAALTRAGILLFLPAALLWIIIVSEEKRKALFGAFISIIALLCVILPVTFHNYRSSGDVIFLTSHAGLNFYIGNNEHADGTFKAPSWARSNIEGLKADTKTMAEKKAGKKLKESEISRFYFNEGMEFIKKDPAAFAGLLKKKLILLLNKYDIYDNADLYMYWDHIPFFRFIFLVPFLTFILVGALGLSGMIISIPRIKELMPLYLFIFTYTASLLLYFINARYRLPFVAGFVIFAGYFISWTIERARLKEYGALMASCGLFAGMLLVVNIPMKIDVFLNAYTNLGNLYMEKGDLEKAEGAYVSAIKGVDNPDVKAYNDLGYIYLQQNKLEDAERCFTEALARDPEYPFAHINLGLLYDKKNIFTAAEREYKEAIRLNPNIAQAHNNIANIYEKTERRSLAIEEYKRAVKLEPDNAKTHYNLGVIYGREGMLDKAKKEFEKSAELDPEFTPAREALKYFK